MTPTRIFTPIRLAQNRIPFDLISYQNDGKGCMAMAAKVERACVSMGYRTYLRRRGIRATIPVKAD
jgi:hypothetical protein